MQEVAIANTKLYVNRDEGFIGTSLKKDEFLFDCSDIDDIIADQHRTNETFFGQQEPVDDFGSIIAGRFKRMHPRARGGGQRRFGAGEKGRERQTYNHNAQRNPGIG